MCSTGTGLRLCGNSRSSWPAAKQFAEKVEDCHSERQFRAKNLSHTGTSSRIYFYNAETLSFRALETDHKVAECMDIFSGAIRLCVNESVCVPQAGHSRSVEYSTSSSPNSDLMDRLSGTRSILIPAGSSTRYLPLKSALRRADIQGQQARSRPEPSGTASPLRSTTAPKTSCRHWKRRRNFP